MAINYYNASGFEQLQEAAKNVQIGSLEYWEFRCKMREKMDDPTYSEQERRNCSILHHQLVSKR